MINGVRFILSGGLLIVIGVGMYFAPKEAELSWYHPLPTFPLGLVLIFLGVRAIKNDG
jgi:hypothetical protein